MTWTRTDRTHTLTTAGPQASQAGILGNTVFHYIQTGAGAVQLELQLSNDNASWEVGDSLTLGSAGDHTYSVVVNSWRWYRINVVSITSTNLIVEVSGG